MNELVEEIKKIIKKKKWLVLSTANENKQPSSSVIMYESDGKEIYFSTGPDTLKTRNIKNNNKVSVTIPFFKNFFHKLIPAPPAELHFQAKAEIVSKKDKKARKMLAKVLEFEEKAGLEERESTWIKITPNKIISTYGVGIGLLDMRFPEKARKMVKID